MMEQQRRLSITVITMNRSRQVVEAIQSCLHCHLPDDTEFVVIDNASNDETEEAVRECLGKCGYSFYYEKLGENLGVGGGRNYAFSKTEGLYVYVLDDDAVIDYATDPDFFVKAIQIMDDNPSIMTLTTQIFDTALQKNRVVQKGRSLVQGVYCHQMFCGGSHFLRRSFFLQPPYLPNKYGYEEIPPSLRVMNEGGVNAFCPELGIIHKPITNKWDWSKSENQALLIKGIATPYAIKSMMFPLVTRPILWAAVRVRAIKALKGVPNAYIRLCDEIKVMRKEYPVMEKIRLSTVCKMARDFGLSAF